MQHIFIVGSKGIPGNYGGFETFVDKLTEYHENHQNLKYHVACKGKEKGEFEYHHAHCFQIKVPSIGSAQAVYYDVAALAECCRFIEKNHITHPIVYILACRIGPFALWFRKKIHKYGGRIFVNPDGHEYLRGKWSYLVREYWKFSEGMMVRNADLLICDSRNIESYAHERYKKHCPKTVFIAYGAETRPSLMVDEDKMVTDWFEKKGLKKNRYYLIVGRFVPENNYETILREFMNSSTACDLAIVTTENKELMQKLETKLHFRKDCRIKFVGAVYDQEFLKKIRESAYGYIHGHEVGGTNPSLLEAMGSTKLNLLLDVSFNREVGEKAVLYWKKEQGNLKSLIEAAEQMTEEERDVLGIRAKKRIQENYSWAAIAEAYEKIFLGKQVCS